MKKKKNNIVASLGCGLLLAKKIIRILMMRSPEGENKKQFSIFFKVRHFN